MKLHFVFKQLFHFPARKQFKTEFVGKLRSVFIDGNIYNKALVFFDFSVAERNSGGGRGKTAPKVSRTLPLTAQSAAERSGMRGAIVFSVSRPYENDKFFILHVHSKIAYGFRAVGVNLVNVVEF